MASPIIAVSDSVFPDLNPAAQVLSKINAELKMSKDASAEEVLKVAAGADALLVTYAKITASMIERMTHCKIMARFGIGVDNIDLNAATKAGILVTNVPDYCLDEVSDHTMALLLCLARKISPSNSATHQGKWDMPAVVPIRRLRGSVLGLVGFGRIAQAVAMKARAFGFKVITHDPFVAPEIFHSMGVHSVEFPDLLKNSDYISIHCPLSAKTQGLFSVAAFRTMKPTAYLINTARGQIVDEQALVAALQSDWIAGAGLDVLSAEPPLSGHPLIGRDDVVLTPHTSFYSVESLQELQTKAAEEVVRRLTGVPPRNPINREVLTAAANEKENKGKTQ